MPIAYVQLDDWWYHGYGYNGNGGVRAVVDWHADPAWHTAAQFPVHAAKPTDAMTDRRDAEAGDDNAD